MNHILLLFVFTLLPLAEAAAQKHDNWWTFVAPALDTSGGLPLDPPYPATYFEFNASPPTITYAQSLFFNNAMWTVMSSPGGVPLFHSNGYRISHFDGALMDNGDGLNPDFPAEGYPFGPFIPLSMMCLPRPGVENDYYLIYLEAGPNYKERPAILSALITDAHAPGTGRVVYKNKPLFDQGRLIEYFQVTRHANGSDWWVVFSNADETTHIRQFHTLLLGKDTCYLAHTQTFDEYGPAPVWYQNSTFHRVFSPDGAWLVTLDLLRGVFVQQFDRCSGLLGPVRIIPYPPPTIGYGKVVVSPNSQFLYVIENATTLLQYDLLADDLVQSRDTIAMYDGFVDTSYDTVYGQPVNFGSLEPGPDGKIYMLAGFYVHLIAQPNEKGATCDFRKRAIRMPTYSLSATYFPNYRLGPIDGSACDTLGLDNEPLADFWWLTDSTSLTVQFTDNSSYEPAQWHWDFGDGAGMSADTNPVYAFPASGVYQVCLAVSNDNAADTICKNVAVGVTASRPDPGSELAEMAVFPNPAQDLLQLRFSEPLPAGCHVEVFDALGRLQHRAAPPEGARQTSLNIGRLPNGRYYCRLLHDGRIAAVSPFVVLR